MTKEPLSQEEIDREAAIKFLKERFDGKTILLDRILMSCYTDTFLAGIKHARQESQSKIEDLQGRVNLKDKLLVEYKARSQFKIEELEEALRIERECVDFYAELETQDGEHCQQEAIKEDHWERLGFTARQTQAKRKRND